MVALLFLSVRVPLMLVREPFFDELATALYARTPVSQHWKMLRQDSASPLYMALARLGHLVGGPPIMTARVLSLAFGFLALVALIAGVPARAAAFSSAALLAVFPPHVYFSTEARAYSLTALLIGFAALSLHRWILARQDLMVCAATLSLALAAYSHIYAVLFFPAPLLVSLLTRRGDAIRKGFVASAVTGVLFLPGLWLARAQPLESIEWMGLGTIGERIELVLGVFRQLGFAAPYPLLFMTPPPLWMQILSVVLVLALVLVGIWRSREARLFALITLLPIVGVACFALAGWTFYFPVRFESVLALPFVLTLGYSVAVLTRRLMIAFSTIAVALGLSVCVSMIAEHSIRPADPFRSISRFVRDRADPSLPVVASGYAYLEVLSQVDSQWRPRIMTFPSEQAEHPGWVASPDPALLEREVSALPPRFVWVGVDSSAEARTLARHFNLRQLARFGPVIALEAGTTPHP